MPWTIGWLLPAAARIARGAPMITRMNGRGLGGDAPKSSANFAVVEKVIYLSSQFLGNSWSRCEVVDAGARDSLG